MGVNKFFVFKEDGTLTRLKSSISRFLDNDPPDNDDKVNIRASISVPASAEGLTPANNLSDLDSAATARTNLSVNSKDEDAQANALKTTAPALYFNGSSSVVTVADDDKLTFSSSTEFGTNSSGTWSPNDNTPALTDGTGTLNQHYRVDSGAGTVTQGGSTLSVINGTATTAGQAVYYDGSVWRLKDVDDLPFSISGWINCEDMTSRAIISKVAGGTQEWALITDSSDLLSCIVYTSAGNAIGIKSASAITTHEGKWIHVAATFGGAGPNSARSFANADLSMALYINGVAQSASKYTNGTYAGMTDTSQTVNIGRHNSGSFFKGHIRNVQLFNRELTADEVAQLARGNDLGFADEWGGAFGGVYTSNFTSDSVNGWSAFGGTADSTTTVGGDADVLQLTIDSTTTNHQLLRNNTLSIGKRYKITAEVYIPSSNTNVDGVELNAAANGGIAVFATTTTQDAWTLISGESVSEATNLRVRMKDGGSYSFLGNGTDYIAIRNVKVTEIGTLADFRAENYDSDTGKIYDLSDNAFVGTNNGATLVGREVPVYETGSWTPSLYYSGTSAATYSAQSGYYTRIGNTVYVRGSITVSGIGASSGAVSVVGLPFTPSADGASSSVAGCYITSAANLTSQPIGLVGDGVSQIELYDAGATGNSALDETNITASSVIKVSATYQIQ